MNHTITYTADDADIVLRASETDWKISDELTIRGFGFNGRNPGPVIEAVRNRPLAIRIENDLPEPTLIHWHGLRVPAAADGTEHVQRPVAPGESYTTTITPPDAGTFWYHSHSNEPEQMERGLYGAFIVRGDDEPVFDAERVLLLDDLSIDRRGRLAGFGGFRQRHDGREGSLLIVNGVSNPVLDMHAGQTERWRIVNASSAGTIRLSLGGRPFRVIGTGGGLIERPVEVHEYLLVASDRVDLAIGPFEEGAEVILEKLPYNRGSIRKQPRTTFGTIRVGSRMPSRTVLPERLRTIESLAHAVTEAHRSVVMSGRMSLRRGVDFFINGERHHHAESVHVGHLQVWDLVNTTMMDHPFHLHGFFFQVLSVDGAPPPFRSWEDVVNVPPRSTVRIAWMPDDRPGRWMYHCHILEHHASGMMAHFEVVS